MVMKRISIVIALAAAACGPEAGDQTAQPPIRTADPIATAQAPSSKPVVTPRPKDPAELDRLILAGYTPHGDHMHPPGVNSCPLTKGSDVVM